MLKKYCFNITINLIKLLFDINCQKTKIIQSFVVQYLFWYVFSIFVIQLLYFNIFKRIFGKLYYYND